MASLARRVALHLRKPPPPPADARGARVLAVIECHVDANVRDAGAATTTAHNAALVDLCRAHGVGLLVMPCPELACLGWARVREPGVSIRAALDTPAGRRRCDELATSVVGRIAQRHEAGARVLAAVGGNAQSPGCAVHPDGADAPQAPASGVFIQALRAALRRQGLVLPLLPLRDAEPDRLAEDLAALQRLIVRDAPPAAGPDPCTQRGSGRG